MTPELREFARHVLRWRRDPPAFAREVLGVDLWAKQREILYSLRDNRRTAVPACHESGKTFVAACAVVHHLVCWQPSKIITTAPTQRQVEKLLWGNIGDLKARMERRLHWNRCQFCLQPVPVTPSLL